MYSLIQDNLRLIKGSLLVIVISVYMNRCIDKLECSLEHIPKARMHATILCLCVVCIHAANRCHLKASVRLNLRNHRSECIDMCLQHHGIFLISAAKCHKHTSLYRKLWFVAQFPVCLHHILCDIFCKTAWAVNIKNFLCLLHDIIYIRFCFHLHIPFHHAFLLLTFVFCNNPDFSIIAFLFG